MVAYNFDASFAQAIIFGRKVSAIKPHRKRDHVTVGGLVHAFCGNVPPDYHRSLDCHRLITAPCTRSDTIIIDETGVVVAGQRITNPDWYRTLAQGEGFASFPDLQTHYQRLHGLPWEGQFIRWQPDKAEFRAAWPLVPREAAPADDTE